MISPLVDCKVLLFFENCVAAALAPAIAATRLGDFSSSETVEQFELDAREPGFKEKRSAGFGSGNLTGSGGLTEERPLTAASYI